MANVPTPLSKSNTLSQVSSKVNVSHADVSGSSAVKKIRKVVKKKKKKTKLLNKIGSSPDITAKADLIPNDDMQGILEPPQESEEQAASVGQLNDVSQQQDIIIYDDGEEDAQQDATYFGEDRSENRSY